MKSEQTYLERLSHRLGESFMSMRAPFITALLLGLLSHGFMFANKLLNHDDIESLFYKGATVTSGRWGLEVSKLLFPDWSMPWIYGLITLALISAAVCLILKLLEIRSGLMQCILAGLAVSFPSLTGTFCFMFTSAPYGLAFLLAVLCVYLYERGGKEGLAGSVLCLVFCLGIYQAYVAITASLFVLLMIKQTMEEEKSAWETVFYGVKALAMMGLALLLYFGVTLLVFKFTGAEFNSYVVDNVNSEASILGKIRMAYENFRDIFVFRNYYVISTEVSRYIHIALAGLSVIGALLIRAGDKLRLALRLVLILMLPLSINCMYLMMSAQSIHTLVLYSFICFYFFCVLVFERLPGFRALALDICAAALLLVVAGNVYFANMTYLKLDLQLENARSFYTSLIAQVKETEGFDESSRLAIIGQQDNLLYRAPELDTELLLGPSRDLVNIYSRKNFFRYYLGFDMGFATTEEVEKISATAEFMEMAEYPYYGSVRKIEDFIVVKLG